MSTQFMSVRRFAIAYGIRGNSQKFEYVVPVSDEGATAKDAVGALAEFHKYMQRSRCLPPQSYVVREIFSIHQDARRNDTRMTYDLPLGENPDVSQKRVKAQDHTEPMFSESEIRDESKRALIRAGDRR